MTKFTVNGNPVEFLMQPDTPLLWALRDAAGLTGTNYGCGAGLCGACTVHVDGKATRSCQVTSAELEGTFSTLQQTWIAAQVSQCGYCQSGMIMAAAALLKDKPNPSDDDINTTITNLCRCGTYPRIRRAIHMAAAGRADAGIPGPEVDAGEAAARAASLKD